MALACPRCGTQNPDGNLYCQACGTPLIAPVAMAPPMAAPSGYQSPYYVPSAPPVPVHRTPWMLIIAGVLAATVVAAGMGTALALLGSREAQIASSGGIADVVPSPTPGLTPSPVASPTTTAQTGLQSNAGFTLYVPNGWSVDSKDSETMVLSDPSGQGSVTVSSGVSVPTATAHDNKDIVDNTLRSKYPDTRECPSTSPSNGTLSGVSGISWTLCFTLTSGPNSTPAAASLFAGANNSGTVYYLVMVLAPQSNLSGYVNAAKPVLQSVHWKLS